MLKKYSILTLLLVAYTIVLAHSIIPHHHHHDDHETEQTASHHHDDDHEDDNSLAHSFANYSHTGDAAVIHQQPDDSFVSHIVVTRYLTPVFEFAVKAIESPLPIRKLSNHIIPQSRHCLSSKGLRAPPYSLV